jgi:uncharacterized OsmC-like protein
MTRVTVNIHSSEGIKTEIEGRGKGNLIVERTPRIGTQGGMGYGGGEILCLAAGACFYNNLQRLANERSVALKTVVVEVMAEWDDPSPVAREFVIKPIIETDASENELQDLINGALQESSVANTITHSVPISLSVV